MMYKNNLISLKSGYKLFTAISIAIVLFVLGKQLYERHIFLKSDQNSFYIAEANKIQSAINDSISYVENCSALIADKMAGHKPLSKKTIATLFNSKASNNSSLINNIAELARPDNHKIKEYLNGYHTEYLVLNSNLEPIASSSTQISSMDLNLLQSKIRNLNATEDTLSKDVALNNIHFRYYKKDPNYAYTILVGISDESLSQLFIDNLKEHFTTPFILLIGFATMLLLFSRVMLNPITLLARNALDIASSKKTCNKPNINTQEAATLSLALDAIETSFNNEKKIQHDFQQQSQELTTSLAANNEFINNLSHEVRTPIHGISALSIGLVENWDKLGGENAHKLAIKIAANSQRLLSLVSNILDIAKIQHDDMSLHLQDISLNTIIQDMIEECRSLYLFDKNIDIKFNATNDIILGIDPDKITQVLRNLLSNAIKVSANGTITISWKRQKDNVCIIISDEGMGIPDQELKTIFESFKQSSRTKHKVSGIGLGLSISHKIIEAHNGKIWAENNPTKGASFIFTLPITKADTTDTHTIKQNDLTSSTKANVMVIDDDEACLLSAEMMLHSTNYRLFQDLDPIKALAWLKQNPNKIDIIMVDMMIPGMSGTEFVKAMKADAILANIPIILQSGTSDNDKIQETLNNGAVDFIRKPYNQECFVKMIEKYLRRS